MFKHIGTYVAGTHKLKSFQDAAESDASAGRFAVADGVTHDSVLQAQFAQFLVDEFVKVIRPEARQLFLHEPQRQGEAWNPRFVAWGESLQEPWRECSSVFLDINATVRGLWDGGTPAQSMFVGVELTTRSDGKLSAGILIVGDSFVFVIPKSEAEDYRQFTFDEQDPLRVSRDHPAIASRDAQYDVMVFDAPAVLILASDKVGLAIKKRLDAGERTTVVNEMLSMTTRTKFVQWDYKARLSKNLEDDDASIVIVDIDLNDRLQQGLPNSDNTEQRFSNEPPLGVHAVGRPSSSEASNPAAVAIPTLAQSGSATGETTSSRSTPDAAPFTQTESKAGLIHPETARLADAIRAVKMAQPNRPLKRIYFATSPFQCDVEWEQADGLGSENSAEPSEPAITLASKTPSADTAQMSTSEVLVPVPSQMERVTHEKIVPIKVTPEDSVQGTPVSSKQAQRSPVQGSIRKRSEINTPSRALHSDAITESKKLPSASDASSRPMDAKESSTAQKPTNTLPPPKNRVSLFRRILNFFFE